MLQVLEKGVAQYRKLKEAEDDLEDERLKAVARGAVNYDELNLTSRTSVRNRVLTSDRDEALDDAMYNAVARKINQMRAPHMRYDQRDSG